MKKKKKRWVALLLLAVLASNLACGSLQKNTEESLGVFWYSWPEDQAYQGISWEPRNGLSARAVFTKDGEEVILGSQIVTTSREAFGLNVQANYNAGWWVVRVQVAGENPFD